MHEAYDRVVAELRGANIPFREFRHEPEGDTEAASALRGHPLAWAAKSLVVGVRVDGAEQYVLAVIPGDARLDFDKVERAVGGTSGDFAPEPIAEQLAGSESGTVMPFSWDERMQLIADPSLFDAPELVFNAGRLDRSIAISSTDYRRHAHPLIAQIAADRE